jgi:hypothetical protein
VAPGQTAGRQMSLEELEDAIRVFLEQVDPETGYIP